MFAHMNLYFMYALLNDQLKSSRSCLVLVFSEEESLILSLQYCHMHLSQMSTQVRDLQITRAVRFSAHADDLVTGFIVEGGSLAATLWPVGTPLSVLDESRM